MVPLRLVAFGREYQLLIHSVESAGPDDADVLVGHIWGKKSREGNDACVRQTGQNGYQLFISECLNSLNFRCCVSLSRWRRC